MTLVMVLYNTNFMYWRAILCTFQIAVDLYVWAGEGGGRGGLEERGGGNLYFASTVEIPTVLVQYRFPYPLSRLPLTHAHVWYIKLPMYLFFYMELVLNGFEGSKSIARAILGGGGLKISTFWGPNGTRLRS
jgi:hypothetical protein